MRTVTSLYKDLSQAINLAQVVFRLQGLGTTFACQRSA